MSQAIPEADVCLILEGTYPFVTGGVSSWVHDLILGMPDLSFALMHISASREGRQEPRYKLPANVVSFLECYVHDPLVHNDKCPRWTPGRERYLWRTLKRFHENPADRKRPFFEELLENYALVGQRVVNTKDLLLSKRSWKYLVETYQRRNPTGSFIDFFWTWRAVHMPLFQVISAETPPAKLYHLVSTGYAGVAGIVAKIRTGRPLLLTEHGIYVKERKIEINRADWIYSEPERVVTVKTRPSVLKEIWIDNFLVLGKLCYDYCDEIFTLYGGNFNLQIEFGAPREKIRIIPNGVKTDIFGALRQLPRPRDGKRRVGFALHDLLSRNIKRQDLILCGPLSSGSTGEVQALLAVEELEFLRYNPATVRLFQVIVDWACVSLEKAASFAQSPEELRLAKAKANVLRAKRATLLHAEIPHEAMVSGAIDTEAPHAGQIIVPSLGSSINPQAPLPELANIIPLAAHPGLAKSPTLSSGLSQLLEEANASLFEHQAPQAEEGQEEAAPPVSQDRTLLQHMLSGELQIATSQGNPLAKLLAEIDGYMMSGKGGKR